MENEELAVRIQNGERHLYGQLWEQNIRLFTLKSYSLIKSYREQCDRAGVTVDDIMQVCFLALLDAVRAYRPADGYKLTTYINLPLRNHFRQLVGIRTARRNPLNSCASLDEPVGDGITLANQIEDERAGEAFAAADDSEYRRALHDALEDAMNALPDECAEVIRRKYYHGHTQTAIAADMGVSADYINRRERKAFLKMRIALKDWQEDILSNYHGTGWRAFKTHQASAVERAVELLAGLTGGEQNL